MTRDDVIAIMGIMKVAYPRFYADMTKKEAHQVIELWASMFEGDNAKIVTEAVKALITTSKFPPTIADVKEKIRLITEPEQMTEIEAWNKVYNALSKSLYNSKESFDSLPKNLQRLVGSPNQLKEWATMDADIVKSVIQSNFMRSYTARTKTDKEMAMLPESTKKLLTNLSSNFSLEGEQE